MINDVKLPFRTVYGPRFAVDFHSDRPSLTKQSFKEECDINNIIARYQKTGIIDHFVTKTPQYGDYSSVDDYMVSMLVVAQANKDFDALPSALRARFSNDPAEFLAFAEDPKNMEEMVSLGLAVRRDISREDNPSSAQPVADGGS